MLHSTRVVLVMPEAYYQSEGETQGQRSQSVVRTMSANTTAKSILETTADLELQCCIEVEERPFMAALRNTKECRPLGPGLQG